MERFWDKVEKTNSCWTWKANCDSSGYGLFKFNKKMVSAHRFAYKLLKGEIPKGLELDHLCRNIICVNPNHLEPVTHKENMLRGISPTAINAIKTHCIHGHEFNEKNTYISPVGSRACRICVNNSVKKYQRNQYDLR